MFRKFFSRLVLVTILFFTSDASAFDDRNYDWICDYEFPATPVVRCVNNDGEFDHNIYYFSAGDNKCLVIVCHGTVDKSGYGIYMHDRYRSDYSQAVAESLAYWTRQGKLRNVGDFNYVFMNTCHAGYASASTILPIYNMKLVRAIDYKGITGFSESPASNGQVMIKLYRCVPKNQASGDSSGSLSRFLQKNNVRGYRSVRSRSSSRPAGVKILYGEL